MWCVPLLPPTTIMLPPIDVAACHDPAPSGFNLSGMETETKHSVCLLLTRLCQAWFQPPLPLANVEALDDIAPQGPRRRVEASDGVDSVLTVHSRQKPTPRTTLGRTPGAHRTAS